eukprot:1270899-Amphidinium_carterae.1
MGACGGASFILIVLGDKRFRLNEGLLLLSGSHDAKPAIAKCTISGEGRPEVKPVNFTAMIFGSPRSMGCRLLGGFGVFLCTGEV